MHYHYHGGWNVQAVIAYLAGVAPPFPGFAASLGATGVNQAGNDLFYLGWLLSFSTSLVVYIGLCKIWPTKNQKLIQERGLVWEELAQLAIEDDTDSSTQGMDVSQAMVDGAQSGKEVAV